MPISTTESTSTRKSIDLTVVPSATGVTVSGSIRWFNEAFTIPATIVPCVYVEDQAYRVALCRSVGGPVLVLADEDGLPAGYDEVCSPIRWRFTAPTDTCATVAIEVVKRTLIPDPPTVLQHPVMETYVYTDTAGVESTRERQVIIDGVPQYTTEIIPAPPLPDPTVFAVSATPVLPSADANKVAGRKLRARIRDLRQQARDLKQAGTTYSAMTAAQRQIIQELVALTGGPAPLAVP